MKNYAYKYEIPGMYALCDISMAWKAERGFFDVFRSGEIQDFLGAAASDISEDDLVAAFAPMLTLPAPGEMYYVNYGMPLRQVVIHSDDPRLKTQREAHGGSVWDLAVEGHPDEMDVRELRALADTAERELEVLTGWYTHTPGNMAAGFCKRIQEALSRRPEDPTLRKVYDRACEIRAKHRTLGVEW